MGNQALGVLLSGLMLAGVAGRARSPVATTQTASPGSDSAASQAAGHQAASPDTNSALEFLGSYTAPSAVLATETSHTSAHPPSPSANRRLRRIESGFDALAPWPGDFIWPPESTLAACRIASADLRRDLSFADSELRVERFESALARYDKVVKAQPGCAPAAWNHAVAAAYAHSPSALAELSAAVSGAPSAAIGEMTLGLARLSAEGPRDAGSSLLRNFEAGAGATAHGTQPPSGAREAPPALKERDITWAHAMLAQASGETVQARRDLVRLSRLEADSPAVWFALAGAALEEARAASRRLSEIAPHSEWDRRLQAEAVAARYPALAQSLWPGNLRAEMESANGEVAPGSEGEAADSPESLYQQAHAALRLSQQAYLQASNSPQFSAYLHALRALAAEQEGDEPAAIREYREGLAQNPASAILHAGLGHLYRQRLDLAAAEPELERARKLDPTDPLIAYELGDVYLRLGRSEAALEILNEALRLDPQLLLARWSRGKAYLALGDSERALQDLEAAAPADSSGDVQFQLARLYRKLGRSDLAALAEKRSEEQRLAKQPE